MNCKICGKPMKKDSDQRYVMKAWGYIRYICPKGHQMESVR